MTFINKSINEIVPKPGCTPAIFRCAASSAKAVFLAGDFNNWSDYQTPMEKGQDGIWTVALALLPGRYEYKFVVDGHWYLEPGDDLPNDGRLDCNGNLFGTMNHVIDVGDQVAVPEFQPGAIGTEFKSAPAQ